MQNRPRFTRLDGDPGRIGSQRQAQQGVIDAEVRATRRELLAAFRSRLRASPDTLTSDEFLRVADRPAVLTAIVIAVSTVADGCVLSTFDPHRGTLRIVRHLTVTEAFLRYFASVDASSPCACGIVLQTGDPVLVDDVTHSSIFTEQPTLRVMLDAGIRAVHAYPLFADPGALLGVLSLHHHVAGRHPGQERVAWAAAQALAHVTEGTADTAAPPEFREPSTNADVTAMRTADDVVTLTVRGPLDVLTAPDFTALAHQAILDLHRGHVLIIDLNPVSLLAVAGVRALTAATQLCAARDVHTYVLVDPGHDARRVLDAVSAAPTLRLITDTAAVVAGRRP